MKRYILHIITFLAALLVAQSAWGQTYNELNTSLSGTQNLTGYYKLKGNTTLSGGTIAVSSGTLYLDLNGYTLTKSGGGFIFSVGESRTLVIQDKRGGGIIKGGRGDRGGCAIISGTVKLEGGTIQDCIATDSNYADTAEDNMHYMTQGSGGAFFINQGAKLVMSGGKILNCKTQKTTDGTHGRGGAVFVDAESGHNPGVFEMTGGEISGCVASFGGAVYVHQSQNTTGDKVAGSFTMSGGTISNCSTRYGGGVYVAADGEFTMSGGNIQGCMASTLGSGVYTEGKLNISGSALITANKPADWGDITYTDGYPQVKSGGVYGGGIYANGEKAVITMSGGTISGNWAPSGGGVMLWVGSTMTMTGGEISGNYALGTGGLGNGGALYIQGATFNFMGGTLMNNTAIRYGGAINLNQSAILNLSGSCTISGNIACHGGGISQEAGECILTLASPGIVISNNTAHGHQDSIKDGIHSLTRGKGNGGGLFIERGTLTIDGATITGNKASGHGGGAALYVNRIHGGNTKAVINSGTISGNSAEYGGGIDLYADHSGAPGEGDPDKNNIEVELKGGTISGNSASENGAGIYMSFNETNSTAKMVVGTLTSTPIIENNTANANGGGLGMSNNGVFDVKNASMSGNTAKLGGAIWLGSGTFTIANGTLTDNTASQSGGGIYVGSGTFTVNGNTTLNGNKATSTDGGGIYLGGGSFTVSATGSLNLGGATSSEGNTAGTNGGGVYCGAAFTVNGTSNIQNNTAQNGGGVYVKEGYSASFTKQANLTNNKASANGGAIYVNGGNISLVGNSFTGNNAVQGGAVYLTGGSLTASGDSQVKNNYSTDKGGAFYVNGGTVTLTSATISGNGKNGSSVTTTDGGAIYVTGTGAGFSATGTTDISSNAATGNGGAVYVEGGDVNLVQNEINSNNSANGGAIYLNTGGFTASGSTTMNSNAATINGGAVYVMNGNIKITGSSSILNLSQNHADAGGAFYVNGGDIDADDISNATISNNYSTGEGGAFYVNTGNISMCKTEMSGNGKAGSVIKTTNGGAIALYNGTFSFGDDSVIKTNAASGNGGGLYISNESAIDITCVGGSYEENIANLGGGIYASGPINLTFAANVENNRATNGGGLYLDGGVNMTFGYKYTNGTEISGLIVRNEANGTGTDGVGGGIYLNEGTLSFAATENLGIYNNAASYEAADIFASGSNTTIRLPYVKDLNLTGFDVPGSELYWVKDFHDGQGRYEAALRNTNSDIQAMILGFESSEQAAKVKVITNVKTCLDLGYDLVFVTFTPVNLATGDNAAIVIYYPESRTYDSNGIITAVTGTRQYRKLLLTGAEPQTIGLPSGYWYFDTTGWTYAYADNPVFSPASKDSFTKTLTDSNDNTKTFVEIKRNQDQDIKLTFTPKTNSEFKAVVKYSTMHINKMKPGGSSTH